jgi:hypothetical protein
MYRSCICGQGSRTAPSLPLACSEAAAPAPARWAGQGQIGSESGERREPAVAAISASRADVRAASEIPSTQAERFCPKVSR